MRDATGCAAVLALHTSALRAFLATAGRINDQHPVGLAQMRHDGSLEVVAHLISTPRRPLQQVLHRVGHLLARLLGQLPAVLPLDRAQQPAHVPHRHVHGLIDAYRTVKVIGPVR
jgi:hypothetical protein